MIVVELKYEYSELDKAHYYYQKENLISINLSLMKIQVQRD